MQYLYTFESSEHDTRHTQVLKGAMALLSTFRGVLLGLDLNQTNRNFFLYIWVAVSTLRHKYREM
jgi:hypothetical protein